MEYTQPSGYVIQLYQYARMFAYNNEPLKKYFNHVIENNNNNSKKHIPNVYLTFGDFDALEIIKIDEFREYHDVSEKTKQWVGRRQSVLLYTLTDNPRMIYDKDGYWLSGENILNEINTLSDAKQKEMIDKQKQDQSGQFFCLSMLSLTNEASNQILSSSEDGYLTFLKDVRNQILQFVDDINTKFRLNIQCEVFGTFSTTEVAIVCLGDEYVDIMRMIDAIKHLKICSSDPEQKDKSEAAFLSSFSVIGIKDATDKQSFQGKLGSALIQLSMNETVSSHQHLKNIIRSKFSSQHFDNKPFSVGEYDVVIETSAEEAIEHLLPDGFLRKKRNGEGNTYDISGMPFVVRNNIRLLYFSDDLCKSHNTNMDTVIEEKEQNLSVSIKHFSEENIVIPFEWEELKPVSLDTTVDECSNESNYYYYQKIRNLLKESIPSSGGAIDMLDLLYADYQSICGSAYNSLWMSDLHRQFKAVLFTIHEIVPKQDNHFKSDLWWDKLKELMNAFKQQVNHLSQSSRMFFDIPASQIRATGQFDLLMHTSYGMTKKILELIYSIHGSTESQSEKKHSELVPLLTVNIVPNVETEQFYHSSVNDYLRTISTTIPLDSLFAPERQMCVLSHELFHYAPPKSRTARNKCMGIFICSYIWMQQALHVLNDLCVNHDRQYKIQGEDGRVSPFWNEILDISDLRRRILDYTQQYYSQIEKIFSADDLLANAYRSLVYKFLYSELGFDAAEVNQNLFSKLLKTIFFPYCIQRCNDALKQKSQTKEPQDIIWIIQKTKDIMVYTNIAPKQNHLPLLLKYRLQETYIKEFETTTWAAIKEACCDIAMITLTNMKLDDFYLLMVRSWKEMYTKKADGEKDLFTIDSNRRISIHNDCVEPMYYYRIAFVCAYMNWLNSNKKEGIESFNENFHTKYIWTYRRSRNKEAVDNAIKNYQWRFHYYVPYYIKEFNQYHGLLKKIFQDFDMRNLDGKSVEIRNMFQKIYLKYESLIPKEEWSLENRQAYNAKRFQCDLEIAHLFQQQKSLKQLAKEYGFMTISHDERGGQDESN